MQKYNRTDDAADEDVDVLAPTQTATWTATYVVTQDDIDANAAITNIATATGTPDAGSLTDPTANESVDLADPDPIADLFNRQVK